MMIKPDGVRRKLVGDIIGKIEKKGLKIVAIKMLLIDRPLAELHYAEHRDKKFFKDLIKFITSGSVVAMIIEGINIVEVIHNLAGKTDPIEAKYGTIRGDYAFDLTENVVHTSDSLFNAHREIKNFFKSKN